MTEEARTPTARFTDTANVYLLTNCDMACTFCYASKGLGRFTAQQLRFVLAKLREHGASHVNLTGGEPLMHPDVLEIVEYAAELGLSATLFTSGSMLTTELARKLGQHVRWFALSLDGTREKNLEAGRGPGHFEGALRSVQLVREVAPHARVRITTVATRINVDHLVPLGELLQIAEYRPDLWRIKQMVPTRRAAEMADDLAITTQQFHNGVARLLDSLPTDFPVQLHSSENKSGDTMCIHPRGLATVTTGDGVEMTIRPLGNILAEPDVVFTNWNSLREGANASAYNQMWSAPNEFASVERSKFLATMSTWGRPTGPGH